jgi:Tol biopolymer transport system component
MNKLLFLLLLAFNSSVYAQDSQNFHVLKGEYTGQKPPGIIPEVFAPGIVSDTSWAEHGQVAISPKGDEIYWSVFSTKYGNTNSQQIFFTKLENGTWTKPALAEFVEDNLNSENGCPVFSPDGNKLFFNSNRPGGLGNMDTWYVERTGSKWGDPVNVGAPYNSPGTDWTPVFTNNGYAYRMGFYNEDRNEKPLRFKYKDGGFSDPEPVTFHPDFFPWFSIFVSPDEDYVIFAAYKEIGYGWLDLYISFKTSDGKWGFPVNMGNKVNTELTERFPVVSPDGKYLFFMRQTETQDFFWVSTAFFDDLKKESIEKVNTPVEYKEIILKSEDLDKYPGDYLCPDFSSPYTISKEGSMLYLKNGSYSIPLVCTGPDKFRYYPGPTKFEFIPDKKILKIINGNVVHVARKQ